MTEYDGWGFDVEKQTVDLFETDIANPVVTLTMEELLEKAGYVKRTESGKKVITGEKDG